MVDYVAWVQRARAFIRGLAGLPGMITLDDGIEPPATDEFDRQWLDSDKCSLPPEIKRFVSSASARCYFRYEWTPPREWAERIREIVPIGDCLRGGADFCEKARFSNYDHRDWFEEYLGSLSALLPGNPCAEPERGYLLQISPLEDNQQLALDVSPGSNECAVVLAAASETYTGTKLSISFDQFLMDWERLGYVALTYDALHPWLDPQTGLLAPDENKSSQWREMLSQASAKG
jgi:hypothetical protein